MKRLGLILLTSVLAASCAGYRMTKFSLNDINLGDKKDLVVEKFGNPFMMKSGKGYDRFYYKEAVDVSNYTYILTTELIFKDSVLIEINQSEEHPAGKIKVEQE